MDKKLKELIALGASVSAQCFPCFACHLEQAKKLGLSDEEVHEAIRVGTMVTNGVPQKMVDKIKRALPDISITVNEYYTRANKVVQHRILPSIRI